MPIDTITFGSIIQPRRRWIMAWVRTLCNLVIDGDTFWTTEPHCIRLANVCAPDEGETGFQKAKETLKRLILNKYIEYNQVGTSYNRIVAEVIVDKMSVNEYMRLEGYTC
jgi:endonuclease YncB( thermonuclease family)